MAQQAVKPLIVHIRADLKERLRTIAMDRQVSMTKVIEQWIESFTEANEKDSKTERKGKKESQAGRKEVRYLKELKRPPI